MPLTASFCQPALWVTGRTICFKNTSDQIGPRPKNPETPLALPLEANVPPRVVRRLPTGEHDGGGTQRVMPNALPGGLTPRRAPQLRPRCDACSWGHHG